MPLSRSAVALAACLVVSGVCVRPARAHPAGVASINRYLGAEIGENEVVRIAYLLDFAELPAYAEIERLDRDHDNAVTAPEREAYLDALLAPIIARWRIEVDGERVVPRVVARNLEAPPGQGGMSTLRITVELAAERSARARGGREVRVRLDDRVYADRSGWRQLGAGDSEFATVTHSSVGRVGMPLAYGSDTARTPPPRVDEATFTFALRSAAGRSASRTGASDRLRGSPAPPDTSISRLTNLLRGGQLSLGILFFVFGLAFLLGAGHALSPGHGKTLVAAYLVGSRGRARHAIALGSIVTFTHTASVFVLGLFALSLERSFGTDRVLRLLEITSGALIVVIAAAQLPARIRMARAKALNGEQSPTAVNAVGADTGESDRTTAAHDEPGSSAVAQRAPASTARGHSHTHARSRARGHAHAHSHSGGHSHSHPSVNATRGESAPGDEERHAAAHAAELASITRWRDIIALGVSGGIVPCPGALVVLLTAIGLHRLGLGLAMIAFFSLGLATVLTAIGLMFVYARRVLERLPSSTRLLRVLPILSSLLVMAIGASVCIVGWVRR